MSTLALRDISITKFKGLESVRLLECGRINALVGKNNSGKSSVLHAIDMAGLALEQNNWNQFQPKLEVKDLFGDVGAFSIDITYADGSDVKITTTERYGPQKSPRPTDEQKFRSILVWPDVSAGMKARRHRTPQDIIENVETRNFTPIDSLDMLYAIKFYSFRNERGLTPEVYSQLIEEVREYFPDIDGLESDRTEQDIATLTYSEYGRSLDILYAGSGLKHFIDILLKTTVSKASVVLLDEPEMGLHPDLQRQFMDYLQKLVDKKGIQVFMATHSPVLLNYADSVTYYRVLNSRGNRHVLPVQGDAIHTVLSDLGIRPSDIFNRDICLLVEGAFDVVFFEHVVRTLYAQEFREVAVGVIQYGGGAAEGIVSGAIDVSNIIPAQKYTFWTRDRDAAPEAPPSSESTKFRNALVKQGMECHIWDKRELEFYLPEELLVVAQQGNSTKEQAVRGILNGDQTQKFRDEASKAEACVPTGKYLRALLREHLTDKTQLLPDLREIVENKLIPWKEEILGLS